MIRTLQVCILSLLIFRFLIAIPLFKGGILFLFYVWVAVFALVTVSQFWILANCIFNSREAKRLFGVVGAGAIAGGIFGGYLTKLLAGILGTPNLIFICTAFLAGGIVITKRLYTITGTDQHLKRLRQKEQALPPTGSPIDMIKQSRHLLLLTGIVGISVMVARMVEYQFSTVAAAQIQNADQLTAFFGFWFSNLNVISLLIQLFVTQRVMGRIGVGVSLLFLPAVIFCGSLLILIMPTLWAAVFLKVGDGAMKNSINKSALELMMLPVPSETKKQAKAFIDVIVDSAATGAGGLLLLALTATVGFAIRPVAGVTLLLVAVWMVLALRIRREYVAAFRLKLISDAAPENDRSAAGATGESIVGHLACALSGSDELQIIKALKMAKAIRHDRLVPLLQSLARHPSAAVRLETLRNAYFYRDVNFSEDARALILDPAPFDPDEDVKTEAMHYLFQHAGNDRIVMLKTYLAHPDYTIQGAALLCAARESRRNPKLKQALQIRSAVEKRLLQIPSIQNTNENLFIKVNCARVIGAANIPNLYPYLHIFLNDPVTEVVEAALVAAGESREDMFIIPIIERLRQSAFQDAGNRALQLFGPGIIPILADYLTNPLIDHGIRRHIPAAMAQIGIQPAVDVLIDSLNRWDRSISYEIIRSLNHMQANGGKLKFDTHKISRHILDEARRYMDMLKVWSSQRIHRVLATTQSAKEQDIQMQRQALNSEIEKRLDGNLERIFRLLGLRYPSEDIYSVYKRLYSKQTDHRINAVDFLDNLLETDLKRIIIPIVETAIADTVVEQVIERLGLKVPSEREAFELMLPQADPDLQLQALSLIALLDDRRYIPLVGELINGRNPSVHAAAKGILKSMGYLNRCDFSG
jgi:AAA family ATP:ADP antiporter